MLSRRVLLLLSASAGVLGLVLMRQSGAETKQAVFEVAKSDEEWRKSLTPE